MRNKTTFQEHVTKAIKYMSLLAKGMCPIMATYQVFGNEIGDELVRLKQHEIILEKPILN